MNNGIQKERDLFLRALDHPAEERAAFLKAACSDAHQLARIERLLSAHDSARSLETRAFVDGDPALLASSLEGRSIGRFHVRRLIAEGGMGVVYEAEQDKPKRRVALKLVRPGLATAAVLQRFEYEAQALGRLQHPTIARIFEAGQASVGEGSQPYFAMELIEGTTLIEFIRERKLPLPRRLELLIAIASGVDYAHRQGVIHRDLKPGNILVDGDGRPHILDFGLARVTDLESAASSLRTQAGELVGTLPYMSPEQISGDPRSVDQRTDVYALGVLTYQAITGRLPLAFEERSLPELADMILHERPTPLGELNRSWAGDLETILETALAKEKERRYASAEALASDLQRYLDHEPIRARPSTGLYLLRKFAQRNRVLVTSIFLAIFVALPLTTFGFVQASHERDEAEKARQRAELAWQQVSKSHAEALEDRRRAIDAERSTDRALKDAEAVIEFLQRMLAAAVPDEHPEDIRLKAVLSWASDEMTRLPDLGVAVAIRLHSTLAETFYWISDFESSRRHFLEARRLLAREKGERHVATMEARLGAIRSLGDTGATRESLFELESLSTDISQAQGERSPLLARAQVLQGELLRRLGQTRAGLELVRQATERLEEDPGPDDPITLAAKSSLAEALMQRAEHRSAMEIFETILAARERVHGDRNIQTLITRQNIAQCHYWLGDPSKAAEISEELLAIFRQIYGRESLEAAEVANNLGSMYLALGRLSEAESTLQHSYDIQRRELGLTDESTLTTAANLASVWELGGDSPRAEALYREIVPAAIETLGSGAGLTLVFQHNLGKLLLFRAREREALAHLEAAASGAEEAFTRKHLFTGTATKTYGFCLAVLRDPRAEATLLEAYDLLSAADGAEAELRDCARRIAEYYEDIGNDESARHWREKQGR